MVSLPQDGVDCAGHAASAFPEIPDTSPWDGTYVPPNPNKIGSGWNEHEYTGSALGVDAASLHADDPDLAIQYDALVVEILRRKARAEAGGDVNDSPELQDDDDGYEGEMLLAPAYMEYVLTLRACPREECSRRDPCSNCAQHDGATLATDLWHFLSDERIGAHLVQYLRVRDQLPAWQSARPADVRGEVDAADVATPIPASNTSGAVPGSGDHAGVDNPAARAAAPIALGHADASAGVTHEATDPGIAATGAGAVDTDVNGNTLPRDDGILAPAAAVGLRTRTAILGYVLFAGDMESAAASYFAGNHEALNAFIESLGMADRAPRSSINTVGAPVPQADEDIDDDMPDLVDVSDSSSEPSDHGEDSPVPPSSPEPSEHAVSIDNP